MEKKLTNYRLIYIAIKYDVKENCKLNKVKYSNKYAKMEQAAVQLQN